MNEVDTLWPALGVSGRVAPPVWILGSGMTCAADRKSRGVPGTKEFATAYLERLQKIHGGAEVQELISELGTENADVGGIYRAASGLYHDNPNLRHGLVEVIRELVLQSLREDDNSKLPEINDSEGLEDLVWQRRNDWSIRPGLEHLAAIINLHPNMRNHAIFTTNFDPLMSVAFHKSNQPHARVNFEKEDYPLTRVSANAPVIYHVHGYWTGSYTLNSSKQIEEGGARRRLARSIGDLLAQRNIIVLGYGGWDDVMMLALKDAVSKQGTRIFWCARKADDFNQAKIGEIIRISHEDVFTRVVVHNADEMLLEIKDRMAKIADVKKREFYDYKAKYESAKEQLEEKVTHALRLKAIEDQLKAIARDSSDSMTIAKLGLEGAQTTLTALARVEQSIPNPSGVLTVAMNDFRETVQRFESEFLEHRGTQSARLDAIVDENKRLAAVAEGVEEKLSASIKNDLASLSEAVASLDAKMAALPDCGQSLAVLLGSTEANSPLMSIRKLIEDKAADSTVAIETLDQKLKELSSTTPTNQQIQKVHAEIQAGRSGVLSRRAMVAMYLVALALLLAVIWKLPASAAPGINIGKLPAAPARHSEAASHRVVESCQARQPLQLAGWQIKWGQAHYLLMTKLS